MLYIYKLYTHEDASVDKWGRGEGWGGDRWGQADEAFHSMTARIHTRDPSGHSLIPWPEANFSHHGCILDGTASMTISDLWWTHDALPKLSHQSRWIGEFFSLFTLLPHSLSDVWIQISVFEHLTEEEYLMSQLLTITKLIYCKSRKFWINVNIWNNNIYNTIWKLRQQFSCCVG